MRTSTKTSGELSLVDANVLVYALFTGAEHHLASRRLLECARDSSAQLCVTSQVLVECFSIITNPKRALVARTILEAVDAVKAVLALPGFSVLPVPTDVPARWLELLHRQPVGGARVFDLQLVATMLANDVRRIYTFNRADFEIFSELEVLTPVAG